MKVPFQSLILVCIGARCSEERSKSDSGDAIRQELKDLNKKKGRKATVRICGVSCLDLCDFGPNIIVEPAGDVYSHLTAKTARKVYDAAVGDGPAVPLLMLDERELRRKK
ncbi:MAG TPA: (2Fe-2S) ferredoxin domain-containing protein [Thermoanaerobaculia bacterium]|nr:(2Fe-2S) ferredoxin domain-containing protein [Thermoanaerobaculia bacterium]